MAELRRADGTRSCVLMADHLVGRSASCALRLSDARVSSQHALIRWDGRTWQLVDRGSRNGSEVDGQRLESGQSVRLNKGAVITFGHSSERWTLADSSAPEIMALSLETGEALFGTSGIIGIPSSQEPECTLFADSQGAWRLERSDGEVVLVSDGHVIESSGKKFRFCRPETSGTTEALTERSTEEGPTLIFSVSSDEDFVELRLDYGPRSVTLGSRGHNYLLLTLARARLADQGNQLPAPSCGWLDKDELADGLQMTPQQVDGEVFRIRKHFTQHGLPQATTVIERRPRTKLIRIGVEKLVVQRS